jgi:hypothetical protein
MSDGVSDPHLCPVTATTHAARRLLQQGPDAPSAFNFDLFMRAAGAWVGASVGGAPRGPGWAPAWEVRRGGLGGRQRGRCAASPTASVRELCRASDSAHSQTGRTGHAASSAHSADASPSPASVLHRPPPAGSLLVGLMFIWLVRVSPASMVAVTLGLQVSE